MTNELRNIVFKGEINESNMNGLIDELNKAVNDNVTRIHIDMSSPGGYFTSAFKVYNYILNYPLPLSIRNIGQVSSCAIIVFLACPNRSAVDGSTFYMHPPTWEFARQANETIDSLQDKINELRIYQNRYIDIFQSVTKCSETDFNYRKYLTSETVTISSRFARLINICNADDPRF